MPFVGNTPSNNYTSFAKQDLTGATGGTLTLNTSVANENEIQLFINHVRQEPATSYTVSGTTVTLQGYTVAATDDIYVIYSGKALQTVVPPDGSVGTSKIASGAVTSAKLATNIQADTLYGKTTDGDSGIDLSTNDVVSIKTANTERLKVDASGDVTISTDGSLIIQGTHNEGGALLDLKGTDTPATDKTLGSLNFGNSNDRSLAMIRGVSEASDAAGLRFYTEATGGAIEERMRLNSSGNFFVGATAEFIDNNDSSTDYGVHLQPDGIVMVVRWDGIPMIVGRNASDGTLVQFRQAASAEGTISVSGSTVSYNGFSGLHESSGIASDTPVGTVCSTIDELDTYPDKQEAPDGTFKDHAKKGQNRADHAKVKVSDSEGDKRVYGVLQRFDNGKPMIASVGIGSVRVTGACEGGDLLESNGDGTAKVQSDDIVKSKTIGKVTIGNSSTDVKLVSCVLYCG